MSGTKKHIADLYPELKEWEGYTLFVKDEIRSFNKKLEEVAVNYTSKDVLAEVEHFQNQFIRQNEACDELLHEFHLSEHVFAELSQKNPASTHVILNDHLPLREKVESHKLIFTDLKHEYHNFLSRYL
jgi:hypothetical protein